MIHHSSVVKVLIVDDSALVREVLTYGLNKDPFIEVIGVAKDALSAWKFIKENNPDVITLDIEMPGIDGIDFLRKLLPVKPIPVLMVSSQTLKGARKTLEALSLGAVDFITKPKSDISNGLRLLLDDLISKIKIAVNAKIKVPAHQNDNHILLPNQKLPFTRPVSEKIIAIGASTGGTEAIKEIISKLPANNPGMIIVQHMPAGFTKMFAENLNEMSQMEVKEAKNGDRILKGRVLIAPGGYQLDVVYMHDAFRVRCYKGERVCGHHPSIEVLFNSIAKTVGKKAIGVLLTGMGKDGAYGLLKMKKAGAFTIAQDEDTSIIYGMPKVAREIGACSEILSLNEIAHKLVTLDYQDINA